MEAYLLYLLILCTSQSDYDVLEFNFTCKNTEDIYHLQKVKPHLLTVFSDIVGWCQDNELPLVITRIIDERIEGVSVSDTHGQGRALDLSVRGWTLVDINKFVMHFNTKYVKLGAISYSDGLSRVAVFHNGTAWHLHIQVRP